MMQLTSEPNTAEVMGLLLRRKGSIVEETDVG
jgi:hypothetical protein